MFGLFSLKGQTVAIRIGQAVMIGHPFEMFVEMGRVVSEVLHGN